MSYTISSTWIFILFFRVILSGRMPVLLYNGAWVVGVSWRFSSFTFNVHRNARHVANILPWKWLASRRRRYTIPSRNNALITKFERRPTTTRSRVDYNTRLWQYYNCHLFPTSRTYPSAQWPGRDPKDRYARICGNLSVARITKRSNSHKYPNDFVEMSTFKYFA